MPVHIGGIPFSRPMIPFTCGGKYGGVEGCGRGNFIETKSYASLLQIHFSISNSFHKTPTTRKYNLNFQKVVVGETFFDQVGYYIAQNNIT